MNKRTKTGANPKEMYQEKIQNEINMMLRREISDPRLMHISITRVDLNQDYSHAKIYWDTFDASKRGDAKKAIEGIDKKMRALLAKTLNVRHTPSLSFYYDSQFEDELKITKLLQDANTSDEEV
jgi:ribosome-binding factor A